MILGGPSEIDIGAATSPSHCSSRAGSPELEREVGLTNTSIAHLLSRSVHIGVDVVIPADEEREVVVHPRLIETDLPPRETLPSDDMGRMLLRDRKLKTRGDRAEILGDQCPAQQTVARADRLREHLRARIRLPAIHHPDELDPCLPQRTAELPNAGASSKRRPSIAVKPCSDSHRSALARKSATPIIR